MKVIYILSLFLLSIHAQAQYEEPFELCDQPGENSCRCSTAPRVCLDGFSGTMSFYPHNEDNMGEFCQGINTQVDNPIWFRFISFCTIIDFNITFSNCQRQFQPFPGRGVQIAVYESCPDALNENCRIELSNVTTCQGDGTIRLTSNQNIPGQEYYVVIDGCFGDICDFSITTNNSCGACDGFASFDSTHIVGERFYLPTESPQFTLIPDQNADQDGDSIIDNTNAIYYELRNSTNSVLTSATQAPGLINFAPLAIGTYTLCMDVGNTPIVGFEFAPDTVCIAFMVSTIDPGDVVESTSSTCPGDSISAQMVNSSPSSGYTKMMFAANSAGVITEVSLDTLISISSNLCEDTLSIYNYIYENNSGAFVPTVGDNVNQIDCFTSMNCAYTFEEVVFEDHIPPTALPKPMVNFDLDGQSSISINPNFINQASSDNCGNPLTYSLEPSIFDCASQDFSQPQSVYFIAEDSCGNRDSSLTTLNFFNYTVNPNLENIAYQIGDNSLDTIVTYTLPSVDDCGDPLVWTQTDTTGLSSGSAFPLGSHIQSYQVQFASGLTQNRSFNVNIYRSPDQLIIADEADILIQDVMKSLIVKSANGNCWKLFISNTGEEQWVNISCPD